MEVQPGRRIEGKLCRTEVFREELRPESRQEMLKWPARAVGGECVPAVQEQEAIEQPLALIRRSVAVSLLPPGHLPSPKISHACSTKYGKLPSTPRFLAYCRRAFAASR